MPKFLKNFLIALLISVYPMTAFGYFSLTVPEKKLDTFDPTFQPGQTRTFQAELKSTKNFPIKVVLYGIDSQLTTDGKFAFSSKRSPQRTLGKWISFEEPEIILEPQETRLINFTVAVPDSATPGSYSGGIIAETRPSENTNTPTAGAQEVTSGAISVARLGVQLFIEVPGEKKIAYELTKFDHYESKNHHNFDLEFVNTGNTILRVDPKISIKGFPSPETTIETQNVVLFPNDKTTFTLRWKKEPVFNFFTNNNGPMQLLHIQKPIFGFFEAELNADISTYDIVTNKYSEPKTITEVAKFNVYPWKIIIILAIIISTWLIIKIYKKTKLSRLRKRCVEYTVQPGDTIIKIAQEHNIKWKNLAAVNELEPPYSLAPGTVILAPPAKTPPPQQPIQPPQQPIQTIPTQPTQPPQQTTQAPTIPQQQIQQPQQPNTDQLPPQDPPPTTQQ